MLAGISETEALETAGWLMGAVPWLAAALLVTTVVGAVGVWALVQKARDLERLTARLDAIEELRSALAKFVADRGDLDLRRIEHVLIEMRDGQKRLEDNLLRAVQRPRTTDLASHGDGTDLAERVVNRLLAMEYERVQIVTDREELDRVSESDGEVLVEARRRGALCKGRVRVRGGQLVDVDLQPAWSTFP